MLKYLHCQQQWIFFFYWYDHRSWGYLVHDDLSRRTEPSKNAKLIQNSARKDNGDAYSGEQEVKDRCWWDTCFSRIDRDLQSNFYYQLLANKESIPYGMRMRLCKASQMGDYAPVWLFAHHNVWTQMARYWWSQLSLLKSSSNSNFEQYPWESLMVAR